MKELTVFLANWDVLKVVSTNQLDNKKLEVYLGDEKYCDVFYKDYHYIKPNHVYYFSLNKLIELGKDFFLKIDDALYLINNSPASLLPDFDEKFGYDGKDLGNRFESNKLSFAFWCPHALKVSVEFIIDDVTSFKELIRTEKGVFRGEIEVNNKHVYYRYHAIINNKEVIGPDPYAKYGYNNNQYSVASNEQIDINLNNDKVKHINHIEHIIYETNVRDFTIHKSTNIVNKGKFLGLIEDGRLTSGGNPCGLDYLKFLGITTLQLQPIFSIATIDEKNPDKAYNWGYDPDHYFVLEGSYSSNYKDPTQVVKDLKNTVSVLHKNNIRVSIDVVYNHMYNPKQSTLEKFVPFYFFRRDHNWKIQNNCGCGGDFASERMMGRKLIIDSLTYLVKEFGVDALRFDLMGLIDINTIKLAFEECKKYKPDVFFYGEGWDMGAKTYDKSECATLENAKKIPQIGFFNDRYRNIVKGIGGEVKPSQNGFILGNQDFVFGFKFAHSGSCIDITYPSIFAKPSQSINYVECHDNAALYDSIKEGLGINNEEKILSYIDLFSKVLLSSVGVPFIHAGQEIGFSKKNHHNTYNGGDEFNNFDYDLLDKNFEHAYLLKSLIDFRKSFYLSKIDRKEQIKHEIEYIELPKGILIKLTNSNIEYIINPFDNVLYYSFNSEKELVFINPKTMMNKKMKLKTAMVPPLSLMIALED